MNYRSKCPLIINELHELHESCTLCNSQRIVNQRVRPKSCKLHGNNKVKFVFLGKFSLPFGDYLSLRNRATLQLLVQLIDYQRIKSCTGCNSCNFLQLIDYQYPFF